MDGIFSSLYRVNNIDNLYTLTNVKYTPVCSSSSFNDISKFTITNEEVLVIRNKMETEIKIYLPFFNDEYIYDGYFLSNKCKPNEKNDSRHCIINRDGNIIYVTCGKITGIFEFEEYLKFLL